MPRPQRLRRICGMPVYKRFPADGGCGENAIVLTLDEYETIRLMDHEGCTHEQCASIMKISRTTVTEIYASARKKIAAMIVEGRELCLEGGRIELCEHTSECDHTACAESCRK